MKSPAPWESIPAMCGRACSVPADGWPTGCGRMADSPHLPDREIHLLLDGALDERAAQAARAHLAACASCALRLETQARLFAAIESWEETPPAHDLVPRVLAGLRPPATPVGLNWAVALQAGVALLIAA